MMKKLLQKMTLTFTALISLLLPVAVPVTVAAQSAEGDIETNLCAGANLDVTDTNCDPADPEAPNRINNIIKLVINIFSIVVGIIAVIMIIIGGLKYITSGGESGNITSAKNTILYAIIGLVVVALAQFIVRFVLNRVATS